MSILLGGGVLVGMRRKVPVVFQEANLMVVGVR